jgi:hypothetical protein
MNFDVPKTTQAIELKEYSAELEGHVVLVWVDPPRGMLREFDRISAGLAGRIDAFASAKDRARPGKIKASVRLAGWLQALRADGAAKKLKKFTEQWRRERYAWYAKLWSQGPEETRWEAAEIEKMDEENPAFLEWLIVQSWARVEQFRVDTKKKLTKPAGS